MSSSNITYPEEVIKQLSEHIKAILELLGENPEREGLVKTPVRAAKALFFITEGYRHTAEEVVGDALFATQGNRIIIVRDIEFYSMCEHHILP